MFQRRKKPQIIHDVPGPTNHEGRLIRKAEPLEVLPHLFHDLGIQSNILISATYTHPTLSLTPKTINRVLSKVISQHPALSIIGICRPSQKTPGNRTLWEAHLPVVKFSDLVEFRDLDFDGDAQLEDIFEEVHNSWFDTGDKTKPLWKLVVLNEKTVVWVVHHSIADGLSGYAFHRSFLEALNSSSSSEWDSKDDVESMVTPRIDPKSLPSPLQDFEEKLSWWHVIKTFLFWFLLRLFVPSKYFLFSDAVVSANFPTVKKPFPVSERTITKVAILRIESKTMQKCLAACREYETSFTALVHTLIQVTLAVDEYSRAKLGFSRQAVSVRNLLRKDKRIGKDVVTDAVSVYSRVDFLHSYRMAAPHPDTSNPLDKERIWRLAQKYKKDLNSAIFEKKTAAQDFLMSGLLGGDDEDFGNFYGLGLYQNNSFLMSNLGVFEAKKPRLQTLVSERGANRAGSEESGWKIDDVAFSAGVIRAVLGDIGIVFNISSVQDGDCVVCACWEEGVLGEEMVRRVVRRVGERLRILVS